VQLVRMTRELMSSLNSARGTKRKETMRELRKNIWSMKLLLHGDSEAEPVPEACAQLTLDMFHEDFMRLLIQYFPKLDLDVRKDVAQVVASLQRQQVAADYLNKNKAFVINENKPPEIVSVLVANRSGLLRFFKNFKTEKVDVQFDQDKAQVVKEIASLSMKMDLKPSLPT